MYLQFLYAAFVFTAVCLPAHAGFVGPATPELDGGMLSSLAAAFTGCYAAFRIYQVKRK